LTDWNCLLHFITGI